jgi:hypothetical protein
VKISPTDNVRHLICTGKLGSKSPTPSLSSSSLGDRPVFLLRITEVTKGIASLKVGEGRIQLCYVDLSILFFLAAMRVAKILAKAVGATSHLGN